MASGSRVSGQDSADRTTASSAAAEQLLGPEDEDGCAAARGHAGAGRGRGESEEEVLREHPSRLEFQKLCDSEWQRVTEEQEAIDHHVSATPSITLGEFQTLCDTEWRKAMEKQWATAWAKLESAQPPIDSAQGAKAVLQIFETPKQDHHRCSSRSLNTSWRIPCPSLDAGADNAPRPHAARGEAPLRDSHGRLPLPMRVATPSDEPTDAHAPMEKVLAHVWSTKALPTPLDRDQLLLDSAAGPEQGTGCSQAPGRGSLGQLPRAPAEPGTRRELVQGIQQLQAKVAECSKAVDVLWKAAQAVAVDGHAHDAEGARSQDTLRSAEAAPDTQVASAAVNLELAFFETVKRAFFNSTNSPKPEV